MANSIHPSEIPGITAPMAELLEAAGYSEVAALMDAEPEVLHAEILKANGLLRLADEAITFEQVVGWIFHGAELLGRPLPATISGLKLAADVGGDEAVDGGPPEEVEAEESVDEPKAVNYELSDEVQAMLAASPFALPLPARELMQSKVSVSQIPAGVMLNHYIGDLDVRVNQSAPQAAGGGHCSQHGAAPEGLSLEVSRVKSTADQQGMGKFSIRVAPGNDRAALIRTARATTNEGRNPESRWFIRGVLHTNPISMFLAALATLLVMVLLPSAVICAALLMFSSEMPEYFAWVSPDLLWVPVAFFISGLAWLIWGQSGRCRVCNQKLFVYRPHLKNAKSHYIPLLGHVVPLCLHLLVFRWFRCSHCGTPIRIKE